MGVENIRNAILEATIEAFNEKKLKFTMDDIARILSISKKTIYTVFKSKDELLLAMVDYIFDSIKESKRAVIEDSTLSTVEKIRKILGVLPESYMEIDFEQLYLLKDRYPNIYEQVENRLETGWEETIQLLKQGMDEGGIRKINIQIFKMMMEASLEQFFQRDVLVKNNVAYKDALQEVVDILLDGIRR